MVILVAISLVVAGCGNLQNPNPDKSEFGENTTKHPSESNVGQDSNDSKVGGDIRINQSNYTTLFKKGVVDIGLNNSNIIKNGDVIQVVYVGNFSNKSRTKSEISYISGVFAGVINRSYHSPSKWDISNLNIAGKNPNGTIMWDFRVEDWWAMNYIKNNWQLDDYINAVLNSGDRWNLTTQSPDDNSSRYLQTLKSRLENDTGAEVKSLKDHGAEAFLTYETDHELNSSQYFDEVANVVDVYKNLTLPRSLNRTDGWYAGVLNIEIRNGNDTLEWYRYRIRWAEERVRGEMTREEEAGRLRLSRFLEKDRLRDTPESDK